MKRLTKWGVTILLLLVVLVAIFGLLLPSIFSASLAIVYSSSMEPAMPRGSLAAMSPVDPASLSVGDIIAYNHPRNPKVTVSHRIIEVIDGESLGFRTKGDANEAPDPSVVPAENVAGRVTWHMPHIGFALDEIGSFVRTAWGLGLLVGLPAVIILGSTIMDANLKYNPRKRRERWRKKREELLKRRAPRSVQLKRAR